MGVRTTHEREVTQLHYVQSGSVKVHHVDGGPQTFKVGLILIQRDSFTVFTLKIVENFVKFNTFYHFFSNSTLSFKYTWTEEAGLVEC